MHLSVKLDEWLSDEGRKPEEVPTVDDDWHPLCGEAGRTGGQAARADGGGSARERDDRRSGGGGPATVGCVGASGSATVMLQWMELEDLEGLEALRKVVEEMGT